MKSLDSAAMSGKYFIISTSSSTGRACRAWGVLPLGDEVISWDPEIVSVPVILQSKGTTNGDGKRFSASVV